MLLGNIPVRYELECVREKIKRRFPESYSYIGPIYELRCS